MFKKRLAIFLPFIVTSLTSCSLNSLLNYFNSKENGQNENKDDHQDDEKDNIINVESISLDKDTLTLLEEETYTFTYTISPVNSSNKNVTWSTTNPEVASISNGKLTALKEGVTTISVTTLDQNKTDSCLVTVNKKQTQEDYDDVTNLGEKTIAEVKDYISKNPVTKNEFGNGVNNTCKVTIKGYALAKIDLIKSTSKYGLDVSEHGKVILGDETGTIGCATKANNQGTCLWGKVSDYVCKDSSKYSVTGYISEYLGHPEILVTSFEYDPSLDIKLDYSKLSSETITLEKFYEKSCAVNYNCAGHGYGDVVTIENLKCYYVEADGQGKRYYNFTDGNKNIRVNAFNLSSASVGSIYNVTGIISLKNLSPIIVAFNISPVTNKEVAFDYKNVAKSLTISQLKAIHGSQEDTSSKYPNVINAYGDIYKTTGYMVAVEENGKLYVGISDTSRGTIITGKTNAMSSYNVVLIKNENFWNTTEEKLYLFNPLYDDYLCEDKPIDIYYVTRQLEYSSNKPMWEILLIPDFISEFKVGE